MESSGRRRPPLGRMGTVGVGFVVTLIATACAGVGSEPGSGSTDPASRTTQAGGRACVPLEEFENGDVENAPEQAADFPWDRADPEVLDGFDFGEVVSGGPPPDGIRPIDDPCFDDIAVADDWLEPQSPVMVVEVGDDRRAYPLAVMTQHEIVNDVVGGEPLVVTYCPLCNSGLASNAPSTARSSTSAPRAGCSRPTS